MNCPREVYSVKARGASAWGPFKMQAEKKGWQERQRRKKMREEGRVVWKPEGGFGASPGKSKGEERRLRDFSGGPVVKPPHSQWRWPGFNLCSGN